MTQGRFGPNEWLVDEIYQQYLTDRASVDPAWWDFFADYSPADGSSFKTHLDQVNSAHSAPERPQPTSTPTNPPADSPPAPQPSPVTADVVSLRGPAARVVTNMEASLAVPTATSVRGMPVKLLVDNRTVINNHLARGRGGKVSFTHLIGYAIVRAISSVPAMNNSFAVVDGKPAIELHDDVNLGIAIDLVKADGSRQLLVPCIKGAQVPDFAGFWAAYEDIVRRARTGVLTADDFAGTTISLTNPGTICT